MKNFEQQEKRKVRAELIFGQAGHEQEYTFIIDSDDGCQNTRNARASPGEVAEISHSGSRLLAGMTSRDGGKRALLRRHLPASGLRRVGQLN